MTLTKTALTREGGQNYRAHLHSQDQYCGTARPRPHPVTHQLTQYTSSLLHAEHLQHIRTKVCFFKVKSSIGNFQCVSDFRPFNIRRRITSMPPCELILLIQPWVLFRLMFLGWYSVPLFRVRTCWYCQGTCWNTPEPSACEEIVSEALKTCVLAAAPGPIQLLNDLR